MPTTVRVSVSPNPASLASGLGGGRRRREQVQRRKGQADAQHGADRPGAAEGPFGDQQRAGPPPAAAAASSITPSIASRKPRKRVRLRVLWIGKASRLMPPTR
jgi:hypothetical protein